MTVIERQLLGALKAMVKAETEVATRSYKELDRSQWAGGRRVWVFNDEIWKRSDPEGFPIIERARRAITAAEKKA